MVSANSSGRSADKYDEEAGKLLKGFSDACDKKKGMHPTPYEYQAFLVGLKAGQGQAITPELIEEAEKTVYAAIEREGLTYGI